ncbi:MAG TPA: hypothetical protein VF101_06125 [Gaiellaceae bacterium]
MHDEPPDDRELSYEFDVSPEARIGLYANMLSVWYSPYEFAFDWGLSGPPQAEDEDDPASPLHIRGSVVARVRIPVGLGFDVMRALNQAMAGYESIFGEIRRPLEEDEPDNFTDET